jgi:hypothetical protein
MIFKIAVSNRAQHEIEEAIEFYNIRNKSAAIEFYSEIQNIYRILEFSPYFEVKFLNIRSIPLNKFPFIIFFTIDFENQIVNIRSCFHNSQSPHKRPLF